MPVQFFTALRNRASDMACGSLLYNWSLRGDIPDRLIVRPVDPWPGNAEWGAMILEGQMPGAYSHDDLHSFVFLRDLRRYARASATPSVRVRAQARVMIQSWIERHGRWDSLGWNPAICGQRLAMWISCYEFFGQGGEARSDDDHDFEDMLYESIARQGRHLSKQLESCRCVDVFMAAQGLLYAGMAFEGYEEWVEQALDTLLRAIDHQILGDGGHKSRSPVVLLKVLKILLDVRSALSAGDYPLPEKIQHAIDKMGQAARFFRYNDNALAVFHGAQEGSADEIDMILSQAGVRGKGVQSLPSTGYERLTLGRTSLLVDCGVVSHREFSRRSHAAPLAFEMTYGRERVFVNCGTHPTCPDWQAALRSTAAHNTAELGHRNACEIREDGTFARQAKSVTHMRENAKNAVLLEASHDGYQKLNGFTHRRRLYLTDKGHTFIGEDILTSPVRPSAPLDLALRFHLHPRVMVSLIRDGQEALLRLPGGAGWRFSFAGGVLSLEDSVYLGTGIEPRKTKQLDIYGQITDKKAKIKWSLRKEG